MFVSPIGDSQPTTCSLVKIAFIIARKKKRSSFVWNSQGAVFYAHQSVRM